MANQRASGSFTPLIIEESPDILQVAVGAIFSFFWFIFCLFIWFLVNDIDKPWWVNLIILSFFLVGIFPLRHFLRKTGSTRIEVTSLLVRFHRRNRFFSDVKWEEPLEKYTGLMPKTFDFGQGNSRKVLYSVYLVHPDESKSVRLGAYGTELSQRENLEVLARRLNKNALVATEEGEMREVKPEEMDLTLREKVEKGMLKETFISSFPAGSKLLFEKTDRGFQVTKYYSKLWMIGFPLAFAGVLSLVTNFDYVLGCILCVLAGIFLVSKNAYHRLIVTSDEIVAYHYFARQTLLRQVMPVRRVEEVNLGRDHSRGTMAAYNSSVMIASSSAIIHFAQGASQKEREWIRDAVRAFVVAAQKANI